MDGTLEKPVVSAQSIRSVNFFNGRMLTAEDMNREKAANREGHKQLGRAVGSGVAYGLEVTAPGSQAAAQPAIVVRPGLAVNRRGKALEVHEDVRLALTKPPETRPAGGATSFDDCTPPQDGVYIVGEGVYLLTLGPAELDEGRAPSSRMASDPTCTIRYKVEAVQFRLRSLNDFLQAEVGDHLQALRTVADPAALPAERLRQRHLLRNRVAYRCFGAADSRLLGAAQQPAWRTAVVLRLAGRPASPAHRMRGAAGSDVLDRSRDRVCRHVGRAPASDTAKCCGRRAKRPASGRGRSDGAAVSGSPGGPVEPRPGRSQCSEISAARRLPADGCGAPRSMENLLGAVGSCSLDAGRRRADGCAFTACAGHRRGSRRFRCGDGRLPGSRAARFRSLRPRRAGPICV